MNDSPADMTRAKSLTTVLGQSEQVKALVEECAEELVAAIQKPCRFRAGELVVRASIGIAIHPQHGAVALELVRNADAAMYRAKRGNLGYAFAGWKGKARKTRAPDDTFTRP